MNPITDEERDALQEVMNISFGQAAAQLAEVIDVFIRLEAPEVELIPALGIVDYLARNVSGVAKAQCVHQEFRGDGDGMAFLLFPPGTERRLLSLFQAGNEDRHESDILLELESEVLLEVANILIGACMGQMMQLLDRHVTYLPPRAMAGDRLSDLLSDAGFTQDDYTITVRTHFQFEDRAVSGRLFLVYREHSLGNIREALHEFLHGYA